MFMFKIPDFSLAQRAGLDLVSARKDFDPPPTLVTGDLRHFDTTVRCAAHYAGATLIFVFLESSWQSMKTTPVLCACTVVITLGHKNVEKGHVAPSNLPFLLIAMDRNSFRRMKEEGQIYTKRCLRLF